MFKYFLIVTVSTWAYIGWDDEGIGANQFLSSLSKEAGYAHGIRQIRTKCLYQVLDQTCNYNAKE